MLQEDDHTLQLWSAVIRGDLELLQELIDDGVDVTISDRNGNTLLHTACIYGDQGIVEELIDGGCDVNAKNENGQTPLHLATEKGHAYTVLMLLDAGCDMDAKTKFSQMTALHMASKSGHEKIVKLLKQKGADVLATDTIGKTPYHYYGNQAVKESLGKPLKDQHHQQNKESQNHVDESQPINDREEHITKHDRTHNHDNYFPGNVQQADLHHANNRNKRTIKNLVVNHKLNYSTQHKDFMDMNVFDRLTLGKGKKK